MSKIKLKVKLNAFEQARAQVKQVLTQRTSLTTAQVKRLEQLLYQKYRQQFKPSKKIGRQQYLSICRHVTHNLIKNKHFQDQISTQQLSLAQLVAMEPHQLDPQCWEILLNKRKNDLNRATSDPQATTSMFRCGKCKQYKCTYFERQDRSADEPMTLHITCCYCGNRWRQ